MEFDALILAGGRSSRLGGVPKSQLVYDGATLLALSLAASAGAGATVVVGPDPGTLPPGVLTCREEPAFAGPAAAIAAGLASLDRSRGPLRAALTLILACDMPKADQAVAALQAALAHDSQNATESEGVMAVSPDGRKQPLAGFYGTAVLERAVDEMEKGGGLTGASVFALLARLDVRAVTVPAGATDDVDTWDDATALGVSRQGS
ncbi:molybdenum cofactor guanylyltransferase [Arthrobacter sp. Y81]|uniref:molybdenum cofactor guanylyltransferase n=1 Tax=Arthrobacter sp. Y81 TaxID=2058897 RepID=UPI001CA5679E|nr:NTP transferase domain-containing protein [Arthrobacter sp. Y81]